MTVYFAQDADNPKGHVKIGFAGDVVTRLRNVAASFKAGISLIATADGGRDIERAFHTVLAPYRLEGEWFRYSDALEVVIEPYRLDQPITITSNCTRRDQIKALNPRQEDSEIAISLLEKTFQCHGVTSSISRALEDSYQLLSSINPVWTRRRVKAIWGRESKRIEFFEIRDLLKVSGASFENIHSPYESPQRVRDVAASLAEWIAPEIKGE